MKNYLDNNYFFEFNNNIIDNFADTNIPTQTTWNEVYKTNKEDKSIGVDDEGNSYYFPPQGGWKANPNFDPDFKTPVPEDPDNPPEPPDSQKGWICSVGEKIYENDKRSPNYGAIIPNKLDIGKTNYKNIRSGKGTDDQNKILKQLSDFNKNYCNPNIDCNDPTIKNQNPQMCGNDNQSGVGYELECYNLNNELVPNCACDPICFPGVLGGLRNGGETLDDSKALKAYGIGPCSKNVKFTDQGPINGSLWNKVPQCSLSSQENSDFCLNKDGQSTGIKKSKKGCPVPDDVQSNQCPVPSYPQMEGNAAEIMKNMGMNQVCQKSTSDSDNWGEIGGGGISLFGAGGFGSSWGSTTSSNSSSGCGQKLLNLIQNNQNIQNIQCSLNSSTATSSADALSNNTIKIIIREPTQAQLDFQKEAERDNKELQDKYIQLMSMPKLSEKMIDIYQKNYENLIKSLNGIQNMYKSTVSGNKTTITSSTSLKSISISSTMSATELISNTINQITEKSTDTLKTKIGTGALDPDIKQAVINETNNNLTNITKQLNESLAQSSVKLNSNNEILVTVPAGTDLNDNVWSIQSEINLSSEAQSKIVSQMADKIANEMYIDASTAATSDSTISGMEDLIKAIADANEKAMKAQMDWLKKTGSIFFIILGVIVLLFLAKMLLDGSSSGTGQNKGTSMSQTWANSLQGKGRQRLPTATPTATSTATSQYN
jgi:hypothetical protein